MDNILIIGGTGTLGREFIKQSIDKYRIAVLSRDEHKQQAMKRIYPNITFLVGDIRDKESIRHAFIGKRYVFHFAALKHIDVCENNPIESIKTNVIGTSNIADLCIEYGVKRCMFSSTDKAVDPISVYGYSKALAESILHDRNKLDMTKFICYRWPNVTGSNGSFIKLAIDSMIDGDPVPVTHRSMSRFFIKIEDAVNFVLDTFETTHVSDKTVLMPGFIKSATVIDILDALSDILGIEYRVKVIGIRGVEKLSETLVSQHSEGTLDSKDETTRFSSLELQEFLRPFVNGYISRV